MPQLSQLGDVLASQLFWLAITLGFIFFVIARGMVPKIQVTVESRDAKIASDLEAAQAARTAAEATEQAWRERMDAARAEAAKLSSEAKQAASRDTETKVKKAADKINAKVDAAEGQIREALESARTEVETVAAEVTQEMVQRLTGIKVDKKEAADAVKAELNV
jgi:F-type H+-transporting ATPase subunit b